MSVCVNFCDFVCVCACVRLCAAAPSFTSTSRMRTSTVSSQLSSPTAPQRMCAFVPARTAVPRSAHPSWNVRPATEGVARPPFPTPHARAPALRRPHVHTRAAHAVRRSPTPTLGPLRCALRNPHRRTRTASAVSTRCARARCRTTWTGARGRARGSDGASVRDAADARAQAGAGAGVCLCRWFGCRAVLGAVRGTVPRAMLCSLGNSFRA